MLILINKSLYCLKKKKHMLNPLSQFSIIPSLSLNLFNYNFIITNFSISLLIYLFIIVLFFKIASHKLNIIPNNKQILGEQLFKMILTLVNNNIGHEMLEIIPMVLSVFIFISINNILGIIPFVFPNTSNILLTTMISLTVYSVIIYLGIKQKGIKYFDWISDKKIPLFLLPMILPIEILLSIIKPFSMSMRLSCNIIAGHVVSEVLLGLTFLAKYFFFIPFTLLTIINFFELFTSILQGYIFSVLTCAYMSESLE